jgi:phenylpyruvate tautomerase PptA (4-oxalocrotonate tautomerase family)
MPFIRFRGVNVEEVKKISRELTDNLVKIIECPREYIFLEVINTTSIFDGEIIEASPFVEVSWFERELDIQDAAASEITRAAKSIGKPNVDVVFVTYKERNYYENGEHF